MAFGSDSRFWQHISIIERHVCGKVAVIRLMGDCERSLAFPSKGTSPSCLGGSA